MTDDLPHCFISEFHHYFLAMRAATQINFVQPASGLMLSFPRTTGFTGGYSNLSPSGYRTFPWRDIRLFVIKFFGRL